MALVRRNYKSNFSVLQDQINRLFREAFPETSAEEDEVSLGTWYPAVDIHETDEAIIIQAELPDLNKEDIEIEVKRNILTLKGKRSEDREIKKRNYHRKEIRTGKFQRSFILPVVINPETVVARYKAGVLEVKITKPEEQKPNQVDIE